MRRIPVIGTAGLVLAWILALVIGDDAAAATEVVLIAAGTSLALSLAGAAAMSRLRSRPLALHLWIAILTTVTGVAAGVAIAGWAMFLSSKDAEAVLVILVAAGTVGLGSALVMASRMNRAVQTVRDVASSIGQSISQRPAPPATAGPLPTRELGSLAVHLSRVSEELHASILRERHLDSSRRDLVAWISHDLRTPLAGIRAMAEALDDGVVTDPSTVSRYHRTIVAEIERLAGLVDDLFRLSRIHSGLHQLQLEAVSLGDVVSDALSLASPVAEAKDVRLRGQVTDGRIQVRLATTEFLRVLRNLLDNAIRHTPGGGRVTVAASAAGGEAIVAVQDGCSGILPEDLDRVFELGFRGDGARTPGEGGAGLGLSIAQGLIEAHGGSISVANDAEGCCFTVRLPLGA